MMSKWKWLGVHKRKHFTVECLQYKYKQASNSFVKPLLGHSKNEFLKFGDGKRPIIIFHYYINGFRVQGHTEGSVQGF